jgi:hypothetical protein
MLQKDLSSLDRLYEISEYDTIFYRKDFNNEMFNMSIADEILFFKFIEQINQLLCTKIILDKYIMELYKRK